MAGGSINMNFNPFAVLDNAFGFSRKRQEKREDEVAQRNYNWAKEFAQNSMQWKAEDLRKAGINPIYGMGSGGYSAPVSSTSPVDLAPAGSIGFDKQADRDIKKATANKINAEAEKTRAEAKGVQTITQGIDKATDNATDYTFLQGNDGINRPYMSQEVSEALENDFISRMGWHGRHLMPKLGGQLTEYYNNLFNTLSTKGKINPLTQDLFVYTDGSYEVLPRDHPKLKQYYKEDKLIKKMQNVFKKPFNWRNF